MPGALGATLARRGSSAAAVASAAVAILLASHPACLEHDAGRGHPERPARLQAVLDGARDVWIDDELVAFEPREATRAELERVHPGGFLDALERLCEAGGGQLDPDTACVPASWQAALVAAGSGISAVERLDAGEATAAFCAVRPPGHHATPTRAMGFCLLNNVAVSAAALAARGERVLLVDYDAHHGNGTQEAFLHDPSVLYVSLHEWPLYPGTGALDEVGEGAGRGATVNLPLPAGATGDVYLAAFDEVIAPAAERFAPTWLVLSAGFDAHRADPLTGLDLSSGDFGLLTARLLELVPPGRRLAFLEGGYDLRALRESSAACLAAMAGCVHEPERPTSGGPGREVVAAVRRLHERVADETPAAEA